MKKFIVFQLCFLALFSSCATNQEPFISALPVQKSVYSTDWSDISELPEDTGGEFRAYTAEDFKGATNGFYLYLPSGWQDSKQDYPVLVFAHGGGGKGDSQTDPDALKCMLDSGIPWLISEGCWQPSVPFIVLIPQTRITSRGEYVSTVNSLEFWKRFEKKFPINKERLYLTGESMGGNFVYDTLVSYKDKTPYAAVVPLCGAYHSGLKLRESAPKMTGIPIWAFHGWEDRFLARHFTLVIIDEINKHEPSVPAKVTIFPKTGHFIWRAVYKDGPGKRETDDNYDPFDTDIYSWMLNYRRVEIDS